MSAIHWPLSASIGARLAGRQPLEGTYHFALLAREAPALVGRAAELAAAETRLPWRGQPTVTLLTRAEWARANVASFARLLAPAEAKLASAGLRLGRHVAGRVVAAELGALLGVLSRRVLGQYELVIPTAEGAGDTVMLVGGNLLAMERRHEFRPAEFRLWVTLHECTHRLQFTGVPWLGPHFLGLVDRLVSSAAVRPDLARIAGEMRAAGKAGRPRLDETGLLGLVVGPEQRRIIQEAQALMSLLEGHGHVMMDRIGARLLVGQDRMSRVLKARRKDPRYSAFLRLTGLEMKMKQYEEGERFVLAVEREAGPEAIDRAWAGPESLPTLDEIRSPGRWLQRVA